MPKKAKVARFGFGPWVRRRRTEIRLTLRGFAHTTDLDPGNLSKYERGVLSPPQDPETLAKMASALRLERASDEYREFMDLAAASAGRIPSDLQSNPKLLARMPLLFRTARGRKLSEADLKLLAEEFKQV